MDVLQNKDYTIKVIWGKILDKFGDDFFLLVDFWDSDCFAFGFKKGNKLIYISTWDYKAEKRDEIFCYFEFETIDSKSFETIEVVKQKERILVEDLLTEITLFMNL